MPERLDALVAELREGDRAERMEVLLDLARDLPPLPPRLEALKDATHRVEDCKAPVYLFVEVADGRVALYADVPEEAPTVRGFVAMLVEGLDGLPVAEVLDVPAAIVERAGMAEILGLQRLSGLHGVVRRLKAMVARTAAVANG